MFLRKIYNELVLIRKELQTLRPEPRFKKYREVQVFEKRYVNQEDSQVVVSFELPGRDWCELSESPAWKEVESHLSQQKKSIEIRRENTNDF